MSSWHSFPKVWSLGHAAIFELFFDEVTVTEKIDGSQFSFGLFNGELKFRSKNQEFTADTANSMFQKAADSVVAVKHLLREGWTYRGEYLQKPKHNVLAYDRTPASNIILFDINTGEESYRTYHEVKGTAIALGFEIVPLLFHGKITSAVDLESHKFLERTSILGGQKIEGYVIKNYARFGKDKKVLMGKVVSEAFKEKHKVDWKEGNPGQNDILLRLVNTYRTAARWDKAIIHLKEQGLIENSPKDIGKIIKEVPRDLIAECEIEIKDALFAWAKDGLIRGINRGLAEYYKEILVKAQQFALESLTPPELKGLTAQDGTPALFCGQVNADGSVTTFTDAFTKSFHKKKITSEQP